MRSLSQYRGCLLGGAIGDALGYPVEFVRSATAIRARYGDLADVPLGYAGDSHVSDDTQMTLFTAEGMLAAFRRGRARGIANVPGMVALAYLRWLDTQRYPAPALADSAPEWPPPLGSLVRAGRLRSDPRLYARRAPGNTCLSALESVPVQWSSGRFLARNDSKGCGGVMRVAPVGLLAFFRHDAFVLGAECAAITHGHPSGYLSAGYFASLVFDLVRDVPLPVALENADAILRHPPTHPYLRFSDSDELVACLSKAREVAFSDALDASEIESLGGGWVGEEALAIAVACALPVENPEPAIVARALARAVTHAGDSDSTGSVAGNLLGARFGLHAFRADWARDVELADVLETMATDLHAFVHDDDREA